MAEAAIEANRGWFFTCNNAKAHAVFAKFWPANSAIVAIAEDASASSSGKFRQDMADKAQAEPLSSRALKALDAVRTAAGSVAVTGEMRRA